MPEARFRGKEDQSVDVAGLSDAQGTLFNIGLENADRAFYNDIAAASLSENNITDRLRFVAYVMDGLESPIEATIGESSSLKYNGQEYDVTDAVATFFGYTSPDAKVDVEESFDGLLGTMDDFERFELWTDLSMDEVSPRMIDVPDTVPVKYSGFEAHPSSSGTQVMTGFDYNGKTELELPFSPHIGPITKDFFMQERREKLAEGNYDGNFFPQPSVLASHPQREFALDNISDMTHIDMAWAILCEDDYELVIDRDEDELYAGIVKDSEMVRMPLDGVAVSLPWMRNKVSATKEALELQNTPVPENAVESEEWSIDDGNYISGGREIT